MRPTSKIGNLVRSFAHQTRAGMSKSRPRMFKGSPAFKKWNIARALALVALMAVGVAIYFNSVSGGAADTASQSDRLRNPSLTQEQQKAADRVDQTSVHPLSENPRITPDDEWLYGPPYLVDFSTNQAGKLSSTDASSGIPVLPEDDPYAYLTMDEFNQVVTDKNALDYEPQRLADSIQERLEVQRLMAEAGADAKAKGKKHTFNVADVRHYENHEGWERGEAFEIRGHSTLVRTEERVIGTFQTSGLEPGAWTMWWIFYNHPGECQNPLFDPKGNQLSQCSFQDRLIDEVGRSPGWGSSSVVGDNGIGNFAAVKDAGDDATGSPAEVNLCCPIVTNPLGAEIHILMRYHGPVEEANAELLLDQLFTWGGGCDYDPALNRGMPGDFDCVDPAMAVHPGSPRQDSREDDD